jgi:hypothetical protein
MKQGSFYKPSEKNKQKLIDYFKKHNIGIKPIPEQPRTNKGNTKGNTL